MDKISCLAVVFLFGVNSLAESCKLTPIQALNPDSNTGHELKEWARKDSSLSQDLKDSVRYANEVYEVDLNNDGTKKLVIPTLEGSGGYLNLVLFSRTASGFKPIKEGIPGLAGFVARNGPWYWHHCYDRRPHSTGESMFLSCGGKTFFSFEGDLANTCPIYIWEEGKKTAYACTDTVLDYTLDFAQKSYQATKYQASVNILNDFFAHCGKELEGRQKLRILSDLSLDYAKLKEPVECMSAVNLAKKNPAFESSKLKSAILYNENLCHENKSFDPKWFEGLEGMLKKGAIESLVDVTVPNYQDPQIDSRSKAWLTSGVNTTGVQDHYSLDLRQLVQENLHQPCFEKHVDENKFVSIFGCRSHSVSDKAAVWVDMKKHISIFIVDSFDSSPFKRACILMGSRTVGATEIPDPFWKTYASFRKFAKIEKNQSICFLSEKSGTAILSYLDGDSI